MNLKKENAKLKKQLEEYKAGWQRTQADFENFRKRVNSEKEVIIKFANVDLICKMLPVLDNLELAWKNLKEKEKESPMGQGIANIKKQFEDILTSEGLTRIKTVGEKFDPTLHEAIAYEPDKKIKKDFILEEKESGFKIDDKIIKPARVVVSAGKKRKE